jgi:hypothetical protein
MLEKLAGLLFVAPSFLKVALAVAASSPMIAPPRVRRRSDRPGRHILILQCPGSICVDSRSVRVFFHHRHIAGAQNMSSSHAHCWRFMLCRGRGLHFFSAVQWKRSPVCCRSPLWRPRGWPTPIPCIPLLSCGLWIILPKCPYLFCHRFFVLACEEEHRWQYLEGPYLLTQYQVLHGVPDFAYPGNVVFLIFVCEVCMSCSYSIALCTWVITIE